MFDQLYFRNLISNARLRVEWKLRFECRTESLTSTPSI